MCISAAVQRYFMEYKSKIPEQFTDRSGITDLVSLKVWGLFIIGFSILLKHFYMQWKLQVRLLSSSVDFTKSNDLTKSHDYRLMYHM